MTVDYFADRHPELRLLVPKLPPSPSDAISLLKTIILELGPTDLRGIIGSSLGGYYAIYLKSCLAPLTKVVLINPAMRPFELLQDYVGENTNYYTGETYHVKPQYMQELQSLYVNEIDALHSYTHENCLLLTQTGDEVLDFQQATTHLPRAKMWITYGGDHAYSDYHQALPLIQEFLKVNRH